MADIRLRRGVSVPGAELEVRTSRSSGPGGQGVNTTDSQVELRWNVRETRALTERQRALVLDRLANRISDDGILILRSSEHRSQHRNREAALARFRALVSEAIEPPKVRRPTRPTRASKQQRLEAKRQRSEVKRLRRRPEL